MRRDPTPQFRSEADYDVHAAHRRTGLLDVDDRFDEPHGIRSRGPVEFKIDMGGVAEGKNSGLRDCHG